MPHESTKSCVPGFSDVSHRDDEGHDAQLKPQLAIFHAKKSCAQSHSVGEQMWACFAKLGEF